MRLRAILFLASLALLFGLNPGAHDTLIRIVGLIVAVLLGILVLRGRHRVALRLRAPPGAEDRARGGIAPWRDRLAGAWHYLALILIVAGWILWAAGVRNGLGGLRLLVGTVAIAVAARLAAIVVLGMLDRYRTLAVVAKVGYMALVATFAVTVPRSQGSVLPRASLEGDIRDARCVAADAPDLLIETTGLRRDLQNGCQLVIDPTGTSYETDRGHLGAGPVDQARLRAPGYQIAMEEYYDDSNAAMFDQEAADGLTPATKEEISDDLPVVVPQGSVTVLLPGPTTLP